MAYASLRHGARVDMHFHVGLLGDQFPEWGHMSEWYRRQPGFRLMLRYSGLSGNEVSDELLRRRTVQVIGSTSLDHVVALALDPVYDRCGRRREDLSHFWVDNAYVVDLRRELSDKVLLGASVHPYDPNFEERVRRAVDEGAVLLKWLPSAQGIDLGDPRVAAALRLLAHVRGGDPLPLLLHVGPEYAVPAADQRWRSYDYLSWGTADRVRNRLRPRSRRLHTPRLRRLRANLHAGLAAGAAIIFAHCGLPYFAPRAVRRVVEHSDFRAVRRYLRRYRGGDEHRSGHIAPPAAGICYADVSALVTPMRRSYYGAVAALPAELLLFGSDYPTPAFPLHDHAAATGSPGRRLPRRTVADQFKALLAGEVDSLLIPDRNVIDVTFDEMWQAFPDHPMFTNFATLLERRPVQQRLLSGLARWLTRWLTRWRRRDG